MCVGITWILTHSPREIEPNTPLAQPADCPPGTYKGDMGGRGKGG